MKPDRSWKSSQNVGLLNKTILSGSKLKYIYIFFYYYFQYLHINICCHFHIKMLLK